MNKYILTLANMSIQKIFVLSLMLLGLYYALADVGSRGVAIDVQSATVIVDIDKEKAKLVETERLVKKALSQKEAVEALGEKFKSSSKQLPPKVSTTEIMRSIDALARMSGVFVIGKEPGSLFRSGILNLYPIKAELRGTYSELVMFMFHLTSLEKVTRVDKFSIAKLETDTNNAKVGQLLMNISILSYEYDGSNEKQDQPDATVTK